ncbi:MAG TPA: chemotaxis protein CheB [Rhodanobacteraceae bacterium]
MAESPLAPSVALLFTDVELGAQLREALLARGARIVHQGPVAEVSRHALEASGADVVVVNLEPADDVHLDHLYDELDDGPYQLVFNDAEASRDLEGWDKARWARHLAAKLLGSGDVDPPRPEDLRVEKSDVRSASADARLDMAETLVGPEPEPHPASNPVTELVQDSAVAVQSVQLEAELEALLESDAVIPGKDALPHESADLHAGNVQAGLEAMPSTSTTDAKQHVNVEQRQTVTAPSPVMDWDLVDMELAPPVAESPRATPEQFGIEKISATDYLKPEGSDDQVSSLEPGIKLELVSLEESLAPAMSDHPVSEMLLGENASGVLRVAAVGVGADGTSDVGVFLAGLPASLPALVLLVQHQHDQHAAELAAALDTTTRLPVHALRQGGLVRHGQVWLVPAGQQCRIGRDGRVSLAEAQTTLGDPSIDQSFASLAETFGPGVTAIILAGSGHDALAGAQEVQDRGGRVWVQDPASCGSEGMAATIHAEGLATFVGSPADLARRLCEEYA